MRRRILKFGGTSLGAPEALRSAVSIVETAARERSIVVVVSALAGVTNALEAALAGASAGSLNATAFVTALRERHLTLLQTVAPATAHQTASVVRAHARGLDDRLRAVAAERAVSPQSRAAVLAVGERLSAPVVAAAIRARGLDARVIDAASLVRTDDAFAEAAIDLRATRRLTRTALEALPPAELPVVTGFIGATAAGETTLLGRGASDLTAAILGWALDAERVEIWSDVDGVMSADPRRVPGARTIARLSYAEATTLAKAGAKVLHPRTLVPLEPAGIPVYVGNTLRPDGLGTWIGPATRAVSACNSPTGQC